MTAETPVDLNDLLVRNAAATFFLRVRGDAMVGAGVLDGDVLVVDRSVTPVGGDLIVASVDGDFIVRYLRKDRAGTRLEAANPSCPAVSLRPGQVLDFFGKVVGVIRKFA